MSCREAVFGPRGDSRGAKRSGTKEGYEYVGFGKKGQYPGFGGKSGAMQGQSK